MRFFEVVLSGAALFSAVWAVELNEVPTALVAGQTYTITYSPKDQTPTTFVLRKGDPGNLGTVGTIGTAQGGSFTWTVPSDITDGDDYAFEIKQGDEFNYSGLIPVTGGTGTGSSTSASPSATPSGYPTSTPAVSSSASASASSYESVSMTTTESTSATPITLTPSASSTGYLTVPGLNSTITTATLSPSSATTPSGPPAEQTENAAAMFGSSPLAILVGAAAMVYLN